ncbi:hypothetical protein GWK08_00160 [Leptobacterium flavescens]|uniref:Uncharacterized protein n=1 Tax=Leptobacterium flavescens TaxID=472055 RepID=A0A6P0UGT1_9FLAO|nr:hypothetical protein [Leptobacterium flavescens]NER11842.1 hypothetical protein [Leptobacterium flavescens]
MKNIRLVLGIVCAVLMSSNTALAQERKLSEAQKEKAKVQLEQYFQDLKLSESQKISYENITKKYADQLKFIRNSELSRQEKLKEVRRISEAKNGEMKSVLSDTQYEVYRKFQEKQRQSLIDNSNGEFAEFTSKLNLSEAQKPRFIEISKRYADQMRNLQNSSKSRFGKYKEFKSIRKNKDAEMKRLLTADQFKTYKEIQKEVEKKVRENRKSK